MLKRDDKMEIKSSGISIVLKEDEIDTLWNIVMFALDYDSKEDVMMQSERNLAKEIVETLEKIK